MPPQVFTPKAAALFVGTGLGLFFYFRYEKTKLQEQRRACTVPSTVRYFKLIILQRRSSKTRKSVDRTSAAPSR